MKFSELKTGKMYTHTGSYNPNRWVMASRPELFNNEVVGNVEVNQPFIVLYIDPIPKDSFLWIKVLNSEGITGWITYCWHDEEYYSPDVIEVSNVTKENA